MFSKCCLKVNKNRKQKRKNESRHVSKIPVAVDKIESNGGLKVNENTRQKRKHESRNASKIPVAVWAEFKKKKNRSAKPSLASNAALSSLHQKSCPADPGGMATKSAEPQAQGKNVLNHPSQSEKQKQIELEAKAKPDKHAFVEYKDNAISQPVSVMESSSQLNSKSQSHPTDSFPSLPKLLSQQESSSSIDSLSLEKTTDESESSSSSDNSTITGISLDSSKDNSTAKKKSSEPFIPSLSENNQIPSYCLEIENDNRPDEDKIFESLPIEEKEKDVLVEEVLVTRESFLESLSPLSEKLPFESSSQSNTCDILGTKDSLSNMECPTTKSSQLLSEDVNISLSNLINLSRADDDLVSISNADDGDFSSVIDHYQLKIKKYQEAIVKRDSTISKLTRKLESTMNANQAAHSEGNSQVEKLQDDINLLQIQSKEMAELIQKQKLKIGIIEHETCACQTESFELCKCDTGVQVDTSFSSLLQSYNFDEKTSFELFVKKIISSSEPEMVQKLKEFLTTHFSHVHIKELVTLLKSDISIETNFSDLTSNLSSDSDAQSCEKLDSSAVLKKMSSLNMVAKLVESLISIPSIARNDAYDFSPSKFQSFFLRRLHSIESGDNLPDMSESESIVSDINYAEVEAPLGKPVDSPLSIEKLRRREISDDFAAVTDFLQDEMDRMCSYIPSISCGPHGDGAEICGRKEKDSASVMEAEIESDHQKILQQKNKLETRLRNLKLLDKELHNMQQLPHHQTSMDSDTMTMSDDNLIMEELPLSCISLLSLTDSEYKGDNIPTDSETNLSRKVSFDMSRSMQEREFCIRCERNVDLLREKYENDIMNLKDQLEKSYNSQKNELIDSVKNLEEEITQLKSEKVALNLEYDQKIKSICAENSIKLKQLSEEYNQELSDVKSSRNKLISEKDELELILRELREKLTFSEKKFLEIIDEKSQNEIVLQNHLADLVQEHEQDLEMIRQENESKVKQETRYIENNYKTSMEVLKRVHEDEVVSLKCQINQIKTEFEEKEQHLLNEHAKTINMIETAHCDQSAVYQKKIEQLLEEKCELLSKTTEEYETILNKNHRALEILCKRLFAKIKSEKEKIMNESSRSGADLDVSLSALEQLNYTLENGLLKFLNQNYFMNANGEEFSPDDTEYLPIEMNLPAAEESVPPKSRTKEGLPRKEREKSSSSRSSLESHGEPHTVPSESSLDSDDLFTIQAEINKLQEEFQKDVTFYKSVNDQLHTEVKSLRQQKTELEDQKENLQLQLKEKEKELTAKESMLNSMDSAAVNQAAQTNSRLLHVLSDLVKTFLDIEHDINSYLFQYGLIPSRSGNLNHQDDDTGQSIGSREDFASLSLGECTNLELTEDGPDLTPRACDVFLPTGNYDTDLEGEDVVLGASRRLRMAVELVLNLLGRALENQQSQDLKLLLKRNEELSHELQEESQGRDAANMELVTAESMVRKLESEKQRLEDTNRDLKDDYEILKRELNIERSKVAHLQQEKESALDEIHTLKEQCELLASRLGNPERTESDKMNSSGTCLHENSELLEENSRLSSEKHSVQKSLSKERQSFLDRLHQMEIALEELHAEKNDLVEKKCKEINDLKGEMESMEKQLQSNRKFIEQQALEREQEREEFMIKISKMEDFVREKERIQSTESQMTKEIDRLEESLQAKIEDHKNAMAKKDEVEKELRQSLDKIRDLRDVISELESELDIKIRAEAELRQKLLNMSESVSNQDKSASLSDSDSSKQVLRNGESMEHLDNLKEQIASQSQEIEMMSQHQTLLHELRGQIHFLEAKVEQRARFLESSFLSAASSPVQSGATSPSESQDSESLHINCEDGWEMSPRSIHWLEIKRLEEKIGRLVHLDEELLKKNKELEQLLKKIKTSYSECQHENTALQEKVSEQLVQISALKSHIDEQKHKCSTPQKSHPFAEKIEELQENLEKQIENNSKLMSDLREAQSTVNVLQNEMHKKEEIIAILEKCADDKNRKSSSDDEDLDFSTTEDLRNQLAEKTELVEKMEKEDEELKSDIEALKMENTSLKSLLEKAEKEVEIEKAQVEALFEEMTNLTEKNKTLEQDFNTVQDMMQQKERELATLHEETEAQMTLEAEMENLEKKHSDQKNVETKLRAEIEELEDALSRMKNLQDTVNKQDLHIKTLVENHEKELDSLNKQIALLKKISVPSENKVDLQELVNKIMDVAVTFNTKDLTSAQEVLFSVLTSFFNSIVEHAELEHKQNVASINQSWQEKINEEISNKQSFFDLETGRLRKEFQYEKKKIKAESDAFWQNKIKDVELMLKSEEEKSKRISDNAKSSRGDLQAMYSEEITALRRDLDSSAKEKLSLENTVKVLNAEIERLKKVLETEKNGLSINYDAKLSAVSKTIEESFQKEKARLQLELDKKLEGEKLTQLKHEDELKAIHKFFEARWTNEMKKVQDSQLEELKKLKENSEKILDDRLKKAKDEYDNLIAEERQQALQRHKAQVELLQEKHEKERLLFAQMKEKEAKEATDLLERRFNENLAELQKNLALSSHSTIEEQMQRKLEEEKLTLITTHRKQLSALRQELKNKYERQLQAQIAAHNDEIRLLEETYNKKVEEVQDLIKEAKQAASKRGFSDSGSNRTATPSSDVTSSDEACSSCQEDMLSANKHLLVDKIHQDGKRVLSLIESTSQPFASVKDAHLWIEERKWIVKRIKEVAPAVSNGNLKSVISELVEEIRKFRVNFEAALEENSELKHKYDDLEEQLSIQYSKLCDVNVQLKKQKSINTELELVLSEKTSELSDLKRKLSDANRLAQVTTEKALLSPSTGSTASSTYEIGCLRGSEGPRSATKFSLFLPDIGDSPSLDIKTPSHKLSLTELQPLPKFDTPPLISPQNNISLDVIDPVKNETLQIKEKLLSVLNNSIDPADAKLHGLYWVYRRSQSYNRALIYQKKYLLMLLMGFQVTEKATLAWLKCMNTDNSSSSHGSDATIKDCPLHGKSRFRSIVFMIVALERMKFYVRRWRLLARIPSSQVISAEIRTVFQNYSFLSPITSPEGHHSSYSLSSAHMPVAGGDFKSGQMSSSLRAANKSKNSTNPDKTQLIEYVHRLEILQKQLGLDSLR